MNNLHPLFETILANFIEPAIGMQNKMSPLPWHLEGTLIKSGESYLLAHQISFGPEQREANASAIVSAVNNTWGAGVNPEVVPALLKTLEQIAAWPGNLEDDLLTSRTGPNDAAARGLMVVAMRSFAKAAIEKAKLPTP